MNVFATLISSSSDLFPTAAASRALFVALIALAGLWLLIRYHRLQSVRMSDAWRGLAADLDFSYRPARGPAFRRKSEEIEGVLDGVTVRLSRYGLSPGLDSAIYTRWSAELDPPPSLVLYVHGKHSLSALARMLGYDDLAVGDAEFDRLWSTKSDAPEHVAQLLTPEVRGAIQKLRSACVVVNETGVNVVWSGQAVAPGELRNGLDVVKALLHTIKPAENDAASSKETSPEGSKPASESEPAAGAPTAAPEPPSPERRGDPADAGEGT